MGLKWQNSETTIGLKLGYRKDDRAKRPKYGCLKIFESS